MTKSQLRLKVAYLQKQGVDITIQWAYGRPRCYTKDEARELSPRLPTGQMAIWLDAFEAGMRAPMVKVCRFCNQPYQSWQDHLSLCMAAPPMAIEVQS